MLNRKKQFDRDDLDLLLMRLPAAIYNHSQRVAISSSIIARQAEKLLYPTNLTGDTSLPAITYLGGICHDVGKIFFSLTPNTEQQYRNHPHLGAKLLERYQQNFFENEEQALQTIEIVKYHHEQPDGRGFPYGLKDGDIPLTANICAIANLTDYHFRKKEAFGSTQDILREILMYSGTLFFEGVADCLECIWEELCEQYEQWFI